MLKRIFNTVLISCSLVIGLSSFSNAQTVDITDKGGFLTTSFAPGTNMSERPGSLIDNNFSSKMYNGTTPATAWIEFKALQQEVVTGYAITSANDSPDRDFATWDFQGSNTDTSWVTIDHQSAQVFAARFQKNSYTFSNTTPYQYYRFANIVRKGGGTTSIQLSEIEIFAAASTAKLNLMAAVGGTIADGLGTVNDQDGPRSAVDSYTFTQSASNTIKATNYGSRYLAASPTTWLLFKGNVKTIAQQYTLTSSNANADRDPKDWTLYASNDTSKAWVKLDAQTAQAFTSRGQTKTYAIAGNTTLYKYYKLDITAVFSSAAGTELSEWQLQGQLGDIPVAPTNVTATAMTNSTIKLQWTDNSTTEDIFTIEQSWDGATNWYRIDTAAANSTSYTVAGLCSNVKYFYRVRAIRNDVGSSPYSPVVSAITVKGGDTYADITEYPGMLTEQFNSDGGEGRFCAIDNNINTKYSSESVTWLQWKSEAAAAVNKYSITSANDDPSSDPKDWALQGSNDGLTWKDIDTRTGEAFSDRYVKNTYTFTNTTKYLYHRFNFTINNGNSGRTQMTEVELYGTSAGVGGLTAPTNLVAVALSSKKMNLSWSDNSFSEESYKIERSLDSLAWSPIGTASLNSTSYVDTAFGTSGKVYYRVAAYSATYGNSAYSNVSSAKALTDGAGFSNMMQKGGTVTAQYEGNSGEGIANLIDGNVATKYNLGTAQTPPMWVAYTLPMLAGKPVTGILKMYTVASANDGSNGRDPVDWTLQATNDSVWSDLHTVKGEAFAARMQTKEYTVNNTKAYNKYRLMITAMIGTAPNYVQLAEWTLYAEFGSVTPVELTSFTATGTRNGASLVWKTATETENHGFEIERSDAKASTWVKVGFVAGNGTTAKPCNYSFTDTKVAAGKYSYRLKQIDNNGTYSYSSAATVEVGNMPKQFTLSQNYPNPFNPTTNLDFTVAVNGRASVKIYNLLGEVVATLFDAPTEAGKLYQVTFNAATLSSGVYFARIESGKPIPYQETCSYEIINF